MANEHLHVGTEFFRLITEFEPGPDDGSVPVTASGAALEAYPCPADKATIGLGCCFHADGTRVQLGDTITEDEVFPTLAYNARSAERALRRLVTIELNQHQFDALASFCFNNPTMLATSTRLLPAINAGRWEDAANEFSAFVYGTTSYKGKPYQRALRGLLRRRLCEACVFLGYDWVEAVSDDRVALPVEREWQEVKGRWRDRILTEGKTTFSNVFRTASMHPLPEPEDDFIFEANDGAVPQGDDVHEDPVRTSPDADAGEDMPPASVPLVREPPSSAPAPAAAPDTPAPAPAVVAAPVAPVGTKPLSPNTMPVEKVPYGLDPKAGAKPLNESDRYRGARDKDVGDFLIRIGALGFAGSSTQGVFAAIMKDPVVFTMVATAVGAVLIAAGGYVYRKFGEWREAEGRKNAVQPLY